tara:strand:+ start:1647 stop:2093 length:447 start_codon:yes stop_codon:yes gene_type:complete
MAAVTGDDHARGVPGWHVYMTTLSGVLAATATRRTPVWVAPYNVELGEVAIINSTVVTGNNTNRKNINVIDGAAEGAGTDEIGNRDLATGTDLEVGKTLLFDNIQGASAERFMSGGDILEVEYEQVGAGVLINETAVYIVYRPANLTS